MRIERECVTHRFIHARPANTAWQCRDVEEYGITSFRRRDKSEPTLVVPFCDFSLATHFLFSSDLTLMRFSCGARSAFQAAKRQKYLRSMLSRRQLQALVRRMRSHSRLGLSISDNFNADVNTLITNIHRWPGDEVRDIILPLTTKGAAHF